jgi:hypothetical protein
MVFWTLETDRADLSASEITQEQIRGAIEINMAAGT